MPSSIPNKINWEHEFTHSARDANGRLIDQVTLGAQGVNGWR